MVLMWKDKQTTLLKCVHISSWDHDGQGRPAVSVVTLMVTKVTTSCLDLVWLRRDLRRSANRGGSTETVNQPTDMRAIRVPLTPKEVSSLIYTHVFTNKTNYIYCIYCLLSLSVRFAEEACSVMMSDVFSACHYLVNPNPFQRFCRYDVCVCVDGEQCLCSALSAYAAACTARGVLLNWRSPSLCGKSLINVLLIIHMHIYQSQHIHI